MSVQSVETLRDSLGKAQRSQLLSVSRYKNPLQAKRVQGARIVECPQNTVELRMLIDKLSSIEKNKRRRISNLDSERYLMKLKYKELLTGKATTMSEDMLLLPPGFRYHANGEPKKVKTGPLRLAKTRALGKTNIRNSATSEGSEQPTNQPKSIEDDILATEEALQDTKRDRALHAISRKISNVRCKMTFLRAHSKREEARTSCVPKGKGTSKSEQFSKSCEEVRPVCKHSSDAFGSHCLQVSGFRDTCIRERWKSVPSGRYVPSPRPGQSKVSSIVSTPRSKTSRSKTGSCNEKTSVRAMSINNQQGSKSQLTCWSTPSLAHRTESETTKRQREFHAKNIRNVREHNGNSSSTNVLEYSSIGPNRTQNILYCHSTGNTRATPRHNNRESRSNIPSKEQDQTKCKTIQTQTATPIENDERKRVDSGETKSRRDSYTDGANQVSVATSTEDSYRYTMRRGSTTDEAKLAILRTILDAEGVTKSQGGNGIKSKGSTCRLQMSKQAIQQIHSLNDLADDAGAVKKQELETKASKAKVDDFLRRLPPPDVSINRWRTSSGGTIQITRNTCPQESGESDDDAGSNPTSDQKSSANSIISIADHDPTQEKINLSESQNLLFGSGLTLYPNHWAQRAVLGNTNKPMSAPHGADRQPAHQDDTDTDDTDSVMRDFEKLYDCRYLRIPPGLRPSRITSNSSFQAWV